MSFLLKAINHSLVPGTIGVGLVFTQFSLLASLILNERATISQFKGAPVLDFIQLPKEQTVQTRKRHVPKLKKPPKPLDMPQPEVNVSKRRPSASNITMPKIALNKSASSNAASALRDGDVQPVVRIDPFYPRKAAIEGIEGFVTLSFTIAADGSVKDIELIKEKPPRIFRRAAKRALSRWKYQPKRVNGKAVDSTGHTVTLSFKLAS